MPYLFTPGGLIVERLKNLDTSSSPAWCSHLKKPVVHRWRVLWKTIALDRKVVPEDTITMSPTFNLWKCLKSNLAITPAEGNDNYSLWLQVSPSHQGKMQGCIHGKHSWVPIDSENFKFKRSFEDQHFSPATLVEGRGWRINEYRYESYSLSIQLLIEFVILNDTSDSDICKSKLCNDLALLLTDKANTDITIKVGTTELGAHKLVLGARSPVLKAMLGADMVEGRTGVIELNHMSEVAAEAFLGFIYSARIDKERLLKTAEELLPAASMYEMPDLKHVCETALRDKITANNTAQFLLLASLHNAELLKADTLDFFLKNKSAVTATEEWKEAVADNSKLLLEEILVLI